MTQQDRQETFWARWLDGTLSVVEQERLAQDKTAGQMNRVIKETENLVVPHFDVDANWRSFHGKKMDKPVRHMRLRIIGIAASFLILVAASWLIWWNMATPAVDSETWVANVAETRFIDLPDQSSIALNADSRITFRPLVYGQLRELTLEGEGYFEVTPGPTFTVSTDHGSVTVLGTSFNIYSRGDRFEVRCATGQVEVKHELSNSSVVLLPGEMALATGSHALHKTESTTPVAQWRRGESGFTSAPLHHILDEVERHYDIRITVSGIDTLQLLTTNFPHDNIEAALQVITVPVGGDYTLDGREVYLFAPEADKK